MDVVMSLKRKYFEKIMNGEKTVEIRKTGAKEPVDRVFFHVSGTEGVSGAARIRGVHRMLGASAAFLRNACVTAAELEAYRKGGDFYGWTLADPEQFEKPYALEAFGLKRAPQSWVYAMMEAEA